MWLITLRDLQWRRRRFAIAIAGTALVFAVTLVLAGLSASFRAEATRTLRAVGADAWVMQRGTAGPFTSLATLPAGDAARIATLPGVRSADPLVLIHQTITLDHVVDVNLFGHRIGGLGEPPLSAGRHVSGSGEAVVDDKLGLKPGASFVAGRRTFSVVGTTHKLTFNAGIANVYITIEDAQAVTFAGQPIATTIVTKGRPSAPPEGYAILSNDDARADLLRPLAQAIKAIDMTQLLLWIVAAAIIGSVVYLSALERVRDFAVLKATGSASRGLLIGLALQAVIVSLVAAIVGTGLSQVLAPQFPLPAEIPARAFAILPGVAVVVGLASSVAGLRRAVGVDPALAFGGP